VIHNTVIYDLPNVFISFYFFDSPHTLPYVNKTDVTG